MVDDTRELVERLCTRIGTLMEDASVSAITIAGIDALALQRVVTDLAATVEEMGALAQAVLVLIDRNR